MHRTAGVGIHQVDSDPQQTGQGGLNQHSAASFICAPPEITVE